MITPQDIKNILKKFKSDDHINFIFQNIDNQKASKTNLYSKYIKPFLETTYNVSLAGGPNAGQARYWIVRGYSVSEAEELKQEVSKTYSSISISSIMDRYNISEEEAIIKQSKVFEKQKDTLKTKYTPDELDNINKKKAITLENMVKKYGESDGQIKYDNIIKTRKNNNTLDGYISRHGLEKGTLLYNNYIDIMTKKVYSLEAMKEYYGEEEAIQKYNLTNKKKSISSTLDWYITTYGETDGTNRFNKKQERWVNSVRETLSTTRTPNKRFKSSKESLNILIPIYIFARKLGILRNDIYIGAGGLREYIRYDKINNKLYAFDMVIESLKIVIEYDGAAFHPKSINEDNWIHPYTKEGPEKYYMTDNAKKEYMINKGFTYFVIRSDDINKQQIVDDILNLIAQLIKTMI